MAEKGASALKKSSRGIALHTYAKYGKGGAQIAKYRYSDAELSIVKV